MSGSGRHCFVVAAYGRSPHIDACLASLAKQVSRSSVIISTSTPFDGIEALANAHGARLSVHGPNRGIGDDWNHALSAADGDLVTIAHQDDLYEPEFGSSVIAAHARNPDAVLSFCDFEEIDGESGRLLHTWNTRVKRTLVASACLGNNVVASSWRRKLLLGLGNPILCPSVTFNRLVAPSFAFRDDMRTNMDWLAWIDLSGAFPLLRIPRRLVHRRVHTESETTRCIRDGARLREDKLVFETLWPQPLSTIISAAYRLSYPGYSR